MVHKSRLWAILVWPEISASIRLSLRSVYEYAFEHLTRVLWDVIYFQTYTLLIHLENTKLQMSAINRWWWIYIGSPEWKTFFVPNYIF